MMVSICCITYNHESYIGKAIEGFVNQKTNFDYEVIIHDDCSTDGTRKIIEEYQKEYPFLIKPILQKENQKSKGKAISPITFKKASGKYIAFCEGDDYWTDPYKLQKQVDFLESHPDFVMCSHAVKTVFLGGVRKNDPFVKPLEIATFDDILENHFIPTLSLVFRNGIINKYPSWFMNVMSGDRALELLLAHYGKNYYMNDVMGIKRKHPGGITQSVYKKINKKFKLENELCMYKGLNKYFHCEHNTVLSKVITRKFLGIAEIELKERRYFFAIVKYIQALYYNPKLFFYKLFHKIIEKCEYTCSRLIW